MAEALSPVVQAEIILDQAELDRLVDGATEHHAIDCSSPEVCPGRAVAFVIAAEIDDDEVRRLLMLTVAELAVLRKGATA